MDEFCWRNTANGVPGKWPSRLKNAWEPVFHFCRNKEIKFRPKAAGHQSDDVVVYSPENPSAPSGSGLLGCGADKIAGIAWPSIDWLLPYIRNARTHTDEQVAQVAASIREFGWTNPLLVAADGVIIAGHARLAAARKLRMTEVPVIVLDHLTDAQRRALVLADNRLALDAGWDEEMLRVELAALQEDGFDLEIVGFTDEELQKPAPIRRSPT